MKLNHECVRDVLLYIEEHLTYGCYMDLSDVEINNHAQEDIIYSVDKLMEADYIAGKREQYLNQTFPTIRIFSITWNGHQFLDNIRDDNVWKNTKNILSKLSSASLSIMGNIASQVITGIIRSQLQI